MDQRLKFAVSMLAMVGGFSALILLAERGFGLSSKTAFFLSLVQPLVDVFGPAGAVGVLMALAILASAAFWVWAGPAGAPSSGDALAKWNSPALTPGLRKGSLESLANTKGAEASAPVLPQGDQLVREIAAAMQSELDRLDRLADERANVGPSEPAITEARDRPIVFAEYLRPREGTWLSYYGGLPTVPTGFAWPMSANDPARPIHFLVQWDCRQLAAEDATGLLPRDGVLYCFMDYVDGSPFDARIVHAPGLPAGWREQEPPASLGPVHCAYQFPYCKLHLEGLEAFRPSVMPRWDFQPVAIDYPAQGWFWNDRSPVGEALLKAQARTVGAARRDDIRPTGNVERPFPRFPHDWAAVRILATHAAKQASGMSGGLGRLLPELGDDDEAKRALIAQWREQAEELFAFGAQHDLDAPVPQDIADDIWAWCETVAPATRLGFDGMVEDSVNSSLGLRSAAFDAVPDDWIERLSEAHALAIDYMRDEYPDRSLPNACKVWEGKKARGELKQVRDLEAPTPNRIFGPPSYVQGEVEEHVLDHVLLLEMSSTSGIDFHLGDGVIQFLIKPEDLRERRFDKVMVVSSSY